VSIIRLSSPIEELRDQYEVIVIGSGYGGAIAACRLARAGRQVCVLEQGKEIQSGEYPDTLPEVVREIQTDSPELQTGVKTNLYDFHINKDMSVLAGCGLGGTSLINAGVALRPEDAVFGDPIWPKAFRDDAQGPLKQGFARAEEMLKPVLYPADLPPLSKFQALKKAAASSNLPCAPAPINVTFRDGVNHVGVEQHACTMCGDCVSGCNYGAKNTLLMNYLPDAKAHGAQIFTQAAVRFVERVGEKWKVHFEPLGEGREKFGAPTLFVTAEIVVLAAGALGSTEILLRSKAAGLALSDQVGQRFSANGDVQAFAYNTNEAVNGIGFGARRPNEMDAVGPCITGMIDVPATNGNEQAMVIEEGVVPGALGAALAELLAAAAQATGSDWSGGFPQLLARKERELASLLRGPYQGAVRNTLTYLVISNDDSGGRMFLQDDRLRISWPGAHNLPAFRKIRERLSSLTQPLSGSFVTGAAWTSLINSKMITVHPLGGCAMSESAEGGVVNHHSQVFCGPHGNGVYDNLYVMDASIIPRSLAVNPLLTISAMAERAVAMMARQHRWKIDYRLSGCVPLQPSNPELGVRFTESMQGFYSDGVDDFEEGAALGMKAGTGLKFTLTIASEDLESMLSSNAHEATLFGTVEASALSSRPLTVTEGAFRLLIVDEETVGTRQMTYRMKLTSEEGKTFWLEGTKIIHDDPFYDAWAETTILYVVLREDGSPDGKLIGKGILRITSSEFLKQMSTIHVTNAASAAERLDAVARFGRFFIGNLWDVFGVVTAKPNFFNPQAEPRKKRPLRAPAPSIHFFTTSDGVQLRLTRYQGGNNGPVILTHGVGVSSLIYRMDTIPTTLVEYLVARGFDVWLLDYRASIELPSCYLQSTADDVATYDYPAAVAKVLGITGATSVQMVVHCFGSAAFFMAMLKGLKGVRSAVSSQVATHFEVPVATELKTGLHIADFLKSLGVESLTAYVDEHTDWQGRLYEAAMRLYPMPFREQCVSPVCHRITFMYSQVFDHQQLNPGTHTNLHEMFGVANITAFEHLSRMVREGHLVTAEGADVYLPHLERLAIPIAFVHGGDNQCFLPRSTEITYDLLCEKNGKSLYTRHVIPQYGHADSILGRNAARDVYPHIAEHLEST
jgi:cholesterol oxidase